MITVTANLQSLLGAAHEAGTLLVQLHAFGQAVPRVGGVAILARSAQAVNPDPDTGIATFAVYGNDTITPAGTYYTVRVEDSNGDLVQIGAYLFTGSGAVDLSTVVQVNPDLIVAPPLPPPVANLLVTLPFAPAQMFDGMAGLTFEVTLTGNHSSSSLPNAVPGNLYTFIYIQDATGGRAGMWPSQSRGGGQVDPTPGAITVQVFVARESGILDAAAPAMYDGAAA